MITCGIFFSCYILTLEVELPSIAREDTWEPWRSIGFGIATFQKSSSFSKNIVRILGYIVYIFGLRDVTLLAFTWSAGKGLRGIGTKWEGLLVKKCRVEKLLCSGLHRTDL